MGTMWMLLRWAAAAVAAVTVQKWVVKSVQLERKLAETEAALKVARRERTAERTGRIRAQRELKTALVSKKSSEDANSGAFPMTPIGTVRSCFSTRNGTPRQPLLVTEARSCVVLYPGGIPVEAFEGLGQYSHCWLLYVFHDNTDLQRLWIKPGHRDFKAKIHVPRLQGGKMGVFATRSPHRPCPIGLSVAKIEGVYGGMLLLSGADIVDGTPVLDIKPYLPYCDSVSVASAPSWVKAGGSEDVLAMKTVDFSESFIRDLGASWKSMEKYSLYSSPEELQKLLKQVLSRDIRSLNQRERPHTAKLSEVSDIFSKISSDPADLDVEGAGSSDEKELSAQTEKFLQVTRDSCTNGEVLYNLVIEGVNVSYTQDSEGHVVVKACTVLQHLNTPDIRNCRRGFTS
ncbi:tRNA (adenine37-N6)-methyltransferase [Marchantia polymorpha subsp. ruderalis]|uniref:TsaA-like domain-containing protein n=2 Tax=Marchantia polymorpha TaxID=3197 RepID=A0AAF6BTY4_MARPO|nr:hypothetical protein MARPO_0045s0079 [Marchantia polymorpha]BBN15468.1 hypothetical protein Mp_6g19840 [Marchantia polymorpha subsp. ruderalis]|eukprot:PTQ39420.1 hypothetical protein MARPO_0045s0079 [Marchantia polymorpha]